MRIFTAGTWHEHSSRRTYHGNYGGRLGTTSLIEAEVRRRLNDLLGVFGLSLG